MTRSPLPQVCGNCALSQLGIVQVTLQHVTAPVIFCNTLYSMNGLLAIDRCLRGPCDGCCENATPSLGRGTLTPNEMVSAPIGWRDRKERKTEVSFQPRAQQLRSEGLQNRGQRLLLNLAPATATRPALRWELESKTGN